MEESRSKSRSMSRIGSKSIITFYGRGILLDIEGTTSSVSFVYDVMFPFVRRELDAYLASHWGEPELAAVCVAIARDAGNPSLAASQEAV